MGFGTQVIFAFEYDAASNTFRPADLSDKPPQGHDAKCGYACHTTAQGSPALKLLKECEHSYGFAVACL